MTLPNLKVKTCCCGCSLRTGTNIIGYLQAISNALGVLLLIIALVAVNADDDVSDIDGPKMKKGKTLMSFILILLILILSAHFITAVLLILGVRNNNAKFLRIWIIYTLTFVIISYILLFLRSITHLFGGDIGLAFGTVFGAALGGLPAMYFYIVVQSLYQEMQEQPPETEACFNKV